MPVYDCSLRDFLEHISLYGKQEDLFPLAERIEMTKRILNGLLYMNKKLSLSHRDIKLSCGFKNCRFVT